MTHEYFARIALEDVEVYRMRNGRASYVCLCDGWVLLDRHGEIMDVVLSDGIDMDDEGLWTIVHPETSRGTPYEFYAVALWDAAKALPVHERVSAAADQILANRSTARDTAYERSIERAQFDAEIRAY